QCHFEMTPESIGTIMAGCGDELAKAQGQRWVQRAETIHALGAELVTPAHRLLDVMLDYIFQSQ
ncbi:MAG: hypothetical protein AAGF99_04600, partial [Bacteroidota bacterium]